MSVSSVGGTYGLSGSGMDIDALVEKLMLGQQAKADALLQKKTVQQWQKTAYNTVYDDIAAFNKSVFNYKLEATLSPHAVTSSDTSVATATANADAAAVSHSLVVAQLASGVNLLSSESISASSGADKKTLATHMGVANSFSLKIANGTSNATITIDPTDSINDVVSAINNAGVNVKASYDSTLDRFFLSTTNIGATTGINITTTSTTTSPATTATDGGDFIAGLHIFPTSVPDASTNTGGTITPVDTTVGADITTSASFTSATGKDAVFQLDGVNLTQTSNAFSISDVKYNLTGISSGTTITGAGVPTWGSATATSVSVTDDVDKAVASIQSLVDSYNKILDQLNDKVDETRYKDYPPLTDAQKAEMKESDITAWEVKAKSGMLANDSTLKGLINTMRSSFAGVVSGIAPTYDSVTGKYVNYNCAASIGITTGDYSEKGKLYLDTDKLKAAMKNNPDVLNQLFGAAGTKNSNGTIDSKSQGIVGRLYDNINKTMDQLDQTAGTTANAKYDSESYYAKRIADTTTQLYNAYDRFDVMQAAYYTKYNAMEQALSKLSTQSSWITSQLSSS